MTRDFKTYITTSAARRLPARAPRAHTPAAAHHHHHDDHIAGEMAANAIISGSQYKRRLISQRTRDASAPASESITRRR
jgi:hypothetical protein